MQRNAAIQPWGTKRPKAEELAPVIAALSRGELVAVPTETVYGIAARADDASAVDRLARLKGRDAAQPVTWHVADDEQLERLPRVSPMAKRLVERYWPGPLTLVLPGVARGVEAAAKNGWTGVRRPAHPATEALLAAAPFPIVASSANLHGEAPLTEAARVAAAFGDELAYIVDGGATKLRESSVVLKLGPGAFQVLREGILDLSALRSVAGLKIGFVCTGNTCRSPMAEGLASALLARRLQTSPARLDDFGFELVSMGVYAMAGANASPNAVAVLRDQGIDIEEHRARYAAPEDVARLDRVYAMTRTHLEALRMLLPPGKDAHIALLDPAGRDIDDPVGGPRSDYERAAAQIQRAIEQRLDEWA